MSSTVVLLISLFLLFSFFFSVSSDRVRAIATAMGLRTIVWTSGTASNHVSFDTNGMESFEIFLVLPS